MTHFVVLALLPAEATRVNLDAKLSDLLEPYCENDEWGRPGSRWDWYMVGGRYSGLLDATYEPEKDPRNIEVCRYCEGTGTTTAAVGRDYPAYAANVGKTCFQCKGEGKVPKWPTQWEVFEGDVVPAGSIDMNKVRFVPGAVLTPDGEWHERVEGGYGMFGSERGPSKAEDAWAREFSRLLEAHRDSLAVVVDCHV